LREREEAAEETAHGLSVEESVAGEKTSVLGIVIRYPGGPAGAGCAVALLA
jgi:hypothetical protein